MAKIRVFNPANTPVIYDDGRTIDGSSWQEVEDTTMVQGFIASGVLLVKKVDPEATAPVTEDAEATVEESPVEEPVETPAPATISKSRRTRKPSPEKE